MQPHRRILKLVFRLEIVISFEPCVLVSPSCCGISRKQFRVCVEQNLSLFAMGATRPAYDVHVRAFVAEWAPHEMAEVLAHHHVAAANDAALLGAAAARLKPWMSVVQLWIADVTPTRTEPCLVKLTMCNRFVAQFDFVRKNRTTFAHSHSQYAWDCMIP